MKDKLFRDTRSIKRQDDILQADYSTWSIFKRLWYTNLKPNYKLFLLASLAMLISGLATGAVPIAIQKAADDVFVGQKQEMVFLIAMAVLVITLLKTSTEYVGKVCLNYLGARFIADLRIKMFQRLAYAELAWIEDVHSGRFLSGFLHDTNLIQYTASRAILTLGENLIKVIILACVMFWMDWYLACLILLFMPLGVLFLNRQRRKVRKSTTKSLQETGDLSSLIAQTLRGIRIVRAYGQEQREIERATDTINRSLEFGLRGARANAIASPAVELLTGVGFALAIYYAGTQGLTGNISLGHFMGFMASAMLIYQPLKSLATLQTVLQEGVAAASRVFGIIDKNIRFTDGAQAKNLDVYKGEINFENVTFSYDKEKPVLQDFSLHVPAGQTIALVGPSGAGKSTLLNLVMCFFTPESGRILIDGQDISEVSLKSLRQSLGVVTQEPILFDDTVMANIAYGSDWAQPEDVIKAAQASAADDFINRLPQGYNTRVGEAGNILSGGEKQRIAIARAFLKNAPILLLDEPTSSLDTQSEAKVQEALATLMHGRTVLVIAHRLSTIKKADVICVVNNGQIVEKGHHKELIASNGLYSKLHGTQAETNTNTYKLQMTQKTKTKTGVY